jgi:predicted O-methyltransferase YrrM/predicted pyridoxine 5'-phosphate oxidase superfamily flavin-nucleotide-binding protein
MHGWESTNLRKIERTREGIASVGILTADMKRVVEKQRLGFFATVCADGTPNVSPKGTTAVWDDDHLIFANIRSPGTLANLRQNPNIEVNVVDPVVRKGYRFKGIASVLDSGDLYDKAMVFYKARGSPLEMIREIVLIRVHSAQPVTSPAYDLGLTEDEVAARWLQRMGLALLNPPPMTAALQATTQDDSLESLKGELERFGQANDAKADERPRRMLNITRDTGEFLAVIVRASGARRVLEIGTSNGYSTLWLAEAVQALGGSVTTIELDEYKVGLATANFGRAGLSPVIKLVQDDAGHFLERLAHSEYDLVFLDAERAEYINWWPHLRRVLTPRGLLIVDNATSHVEEIAPFVSLVTADVDFATCLVPVGKGEFLAVKTAS